MALVAFLTDAKSLNMHMYYMTEFIKWFNGCHPLLNVAKTNVSWKQQEHSAYNLLKPVTIIGQEVVLVSPLNYFATVLDQTFTFSGHVDCIFKKSTIKTFCNTKVRCRSAKSF